VTDSEKAPLSLAPLLFGLGGVALILLILIVIVLLTRAKPEPPATPTPTPIQSAAPTPSLPPIPPDFAEQAQALLDREDLRALRALVGPYAEEGDPVAQLYAGLAALKSSPPDLKGLRLLARSAEQGIGDAAYALARYHLSRGEQGHQECFEWATAAADQDHVFGMTLLGELYLKGQGTKVDTPQGLNWLRQGAAAQDPVAMRVLGLVYTEGLHGTPVDFPRGLQWFERAAELGDPLACHTVGHLLIWQRAKKPSPEELSRARRLLQRSASGGNKRGLADLGWMTLCGLGTPPDEAGGLALIKESAEADVTEAIYLLARIYWRGQGGIAADPAQAIPWLRKGAALGSGDCAHQLAQAYEDGKGGLPQDGVEAMRFYERGAELGHTTAALSLAIHLLTGRFGDPDPPRAKKLLEFAAEHGEANAALTLAGLHSGAKDFPRDLRRAYRLYLQAAEAGNLDGIAHAARVMDRGVGGPRDRQGALRWAKLGAERGHARSMFMLGSILYEGRPEVKQDVAAGRKWLLQAAAAEDRMAQGYVKRKGIR
jgi:uncharacterized protein